ncbi:MAG: ATP-dependent protease La [Verrucomicrobiales bacterium]|nr:ATP-dependent protease La [Verrucomicrobiales bacterium]
MTAASGILPYALSAEEAPVTLSNDAVKGTEGAPEIPMPKNRSVVNALLVTDLPGQGAAGAAAKLSTLTLPIEATSSTEVKFNVRVGPQMNTALGEVVKCLQIRHKGWPRGHRIELAFEDKFVPKDGPSAAVACALLLDSMFGNWEIDPTVAFTGDLNADGSVQPIGGVGGKIRGATKAGCMRVAVPVKNSADVGDVLLAEGPEPLARINILSIDTLDSAIALARKTPAGAAAPAPAPAAAKGAAAPAAATATALAVTGTPLQLFAEVRRVLLPNNKWNANGLRDRNVVIRLKEILRQQPNDLSARYLLAAATNTAPARMTLRGSIETLDQIAFNVFQAIRSKNADQMTKIKSDQIGDAVFKLKRIRTRMDTRVVPTIDALANFGEVLRAIKNQPPRTEAKSVEYYNKLMGAAQAADRQYDALMKNRDVVEELMK